MNKRVVITGMGIISPLGNNINEYWENLINGKSGVGYITKFNPEEKGISVKIAAEVKNFNPEEYIDKKRDKENGPIFPICYGSCKSGYKTGRS